jgi:hypothetical protein
MASFPAINYAYSRYQCALRACLVLGYTQLAYAHLSGANSGSFIFSNGK